MLHEFYASPEPKDNLEINARNQMINFITLLSYGAPQVLHLNPLSKTKDYEVNEFVFRI